jgi:hypothetical protein
MGSDVDTGETWKAESGNFQILLGLAKIENSRRVEYEVVINTAAVMR